MADGHFLSPDDVRILKRVVSWFRGGGPGKSSRPVPTRRRVFGGGGGPGANYYTAVIPYNSEQDAITAATYLPEDEGQELPRRRVSGFGSAYKYIPIEESSAEQVSTQPTIVKSHWTKGFNASSEDKALIGHFVNDSLIEIDCEEIDFPAPWPPTEQA